MDWPATAEELVRAQEAIARVAHEPWTRPDEPFLVGGCFVCFGRGGSGHGEAGEPGWAGAVLMRRDRTVGRAVASGPAGAPYAPGLLALREGALLARVVGALPERPAVLLVNGTGRDHPRGAGLAVHLGAVLDLATVGVTDRPLVATGADPGPDRGATAPLVLDGDVVAQWVRTRAGVRPVVAHAGWGTDPDTATRLLLETAHRARTPEPTRRARELARRARTRGSYS